MELSTSAASGVVVLCSLRLIHARGALRGKKWRRKKEERRVRVWWIQASDGLESRWIGTHYDGEEEKKRRRKWSNEEKKTGGFLQLRKKNMQKRNKGRKKLLFLIENSLRSISRKGWSEWRFVFLPPAPPFSCASTKIECLWYHTCLPFPAYVYVYVQREDNK